ncbi:MAG: hypothetical protein AAB821_03175 [Patescibacteria group bacterium]
MKETLEHSLSLIIRRFQQSFDRLNGEEIMASPELTNDTIGLLVASGRVPEAVSLALKCKGKRRKIYHLNHLIWWAKRFDEGFGQEDDFLTYLLVRDLRVAARLLISSIDGKCDRWKYYLRAYHFTGDLEDLVLASKTFILSRHVSFGWFMVAICKTVSTKKISEHLAFVREKLLRWSGQQYLGHEAEARSWLYLYKASRERQDLYAAKKAMRTIDRGDEKNFEIWKFFATVTRNKKLLLELLESQKNQRMLAESQFEERVETELNLLYEVVTISDDFRQSLALLEMIQSKVGPEEEEE